MTSIDAYRAAGELFGRIQSELDTGDLEMANRLPGNICYNCWIKTCDGTYLISRSVSLQELGQIRSVEILASLIIEQWAEELQAIMAPNPHPED